MSKEIQDLVKKINVLCHNLSEKEKAESSPRVASDDSHPDLNKEESLTEALDTLSTEFQLTVRTKISLTRRQTSILLSILNYQSVRFGINLGMYLALEHLSYQLLGNKLDPFEIRDKHERRTVCTTQIILQAIGGKEILINRQLLLQPGIQQAIIENNLILDKRVYGSRKTIYRPEDLLIIQAVPLSSKFERIKGTSERYSSYCKGYGESHPSARRQKTKPTFELDGNTEDHEIYPLQDIYGDLVLNWLEIRAKFLRLRG